jgi:phosphatidylserine decarboxylase
MRFAPEGLPFILAGLILALAGWSSLLLLPRAAGVSLGVLFTVLALFVSWFFRDPERTDPGGETTVVAPADGKVIDIVEVNEPTVFGGPARRISIFLSVFNVHVQRAPVAGEVVHRDYHPGGYAVAWHPKASDENERASVGIRTASGPVLVRQIAGLIARRIVTYPEEGDTLRRGERIGLIRFGSRVDLFIPLSWEVRVEPGDATVGGETVMAGAVVPAPAAGVAEPDTSEKEDEA